MGLKRWVFGWVAYNWVFKYVYPLTLCTHKFSLYLGIFTLFDHFPDHTLTVISRNVRASVEHHRYVSGTKKNPGCSVFSFGKSIMIENFELFIDKYIGIQERQVVHMPTKILYTPKKLVGTY